MPHTELKLFIYGKNEKSDSAIKELNNICETEFGQKYKLIIIDVLESPELAEKEKILATPTLIQTLPHPIKRIVGELHDIDKLLKALEINKKQ